MICDWQSTVLANIISGLIDKRSEVKFEGSMNWLQLLLEQTKRAESPRSFMVWAGLTAISAVVNNKVWIDKGGLYNLYPNIYVMLIGPSGLRKSFPPMVMRKLVGMVGNTRVIAGRSSVQQIISKLGKAHTAPGKGLIKDAIAYINAGELATSLVRDQDALTLLTDLHDGNYNKEWAYNLKSGTDELKNICITMVGAINPELFGGFISQKEIGGGFIARNFLIYETRRSQKDALLRKKIDDQIDYELLSKHLFELTKLNGEFVIEEEAILAYEDWYSKFEPEDMDDRTGSANRIHDQILKVAMLLSLCERADNLIITKIEMEKAFNLCTQSTASVNRVLAGTGIHVDAPKIKLIIDRLLAAPDFSLSRKEILAKNYGSIDRFDLDRIVGTLEEAGGLKVDGYGGDAVYTLTEKALEGLK